MNSTKILSLLVLGLLFIGITVGCEEDSRSPFSSKCQGGYHYNNEELSSMTAQNYFVDTACPCSASCPNLGPEGIYVGAAKSVINPTFDNPVYIAGFGYREANAVRDDLYSRALVLQHKGVKMAIVALDLIGLFYPPIVEIKLELLSYGFDYVFIASVHNHNGPDTLGPYGPEGKNGVDPDYMVLLKDRIITSVLEADNAKAEANFRFGSDTLLNLTNDLRDPQVKDEKFDVLQFVRADNQENISVILRWGNHPEAAGPDGLELTPDFPGYACNNLDEELGGTSLYLSGCLGGMMTPLGVSVPYDEWEVTEESILKARALGDIVSEKALEIIIPQPFETKVDLAFRAKTIYLPAENSILRMGAILGIYERDLYKNGVVDNINGDSVRTEIVALRIGNAVIGSVPGELFPELAMGGIGEPYGDYPSAEEETPLIQAVEGLPFYTFVGLGNDELGYIIPKKQYDSEEYEEYFSVGPSEAGIINNTLIECIQELP